MPTKQIKELPAWPAWRCRDPEHSPPSHRYFPPGMYEHECPSCRGKTRFIVQGVWL